MPLRTQHPIQSRPLRSEDNGMSRSGTPPDRTTAVQTHHSNVTRVAPHPHVITASDMRSSRKEKHDKVRALKLHVQDQFSDSQSPNFTDKMGAGFDKGSKQGLNRAATTVPKLPAQASYETAFDDTLTLEVDDESAYRDNDYENVTTVFRGIQDIGSQRSIDPAQVGRIDKDTFAATPPRENIEMYADQDWRSQAPQERGPQQREEAAWYRGREANSPRTAQRVHGISHHNVLLQENLMDTPSKIHNLVPIREPGPVKRTPLPAKSVTFKTPISGKRNVARADSPELTIPTGRPTETVVEITRIDPTANFASSANSTHAIYDRQSDAEQSFVPASTISGQKLDLAEKLQTSTFDSSRASDYPTSSEDENASVPSRAPTPPPEPGNDQNIRKRRREEELDYEKKVLGSMAFEDLLREDFGDDPRAHLRTSTFNAQGNPMMSLRERLENLDQMSEEEQRVMFRNQGDDEFAQIGSWFIQQFQDELKRLMSVRLQRRKISMKFEDEIRRRQKVIECSTAGVENELKDLKKGGGELIKGRDVSSRRSTPQKK